MPSRGLHLAKRQGLSFTHAQCRNLSSSASRIRTTRLSSPSLLTAARPHSWRVAAPISLSAITAIRHASTESPAAPPSAAPQTPDLPNLDTITLDNMDLSALADVPEKIGFLSELGINYGYGITSTLQYLVEHLHISAGLPWWASIVTTGVLVRLIMVPLYIRSSDVTAKSQAMAPVLAPMMEKVKAAQKSGDREALMLAYQNMSMVRKRAGISAVKQLMPVAAQGILGFCGFRLCRAMATLPVPGLETGGFLWLSDLTVPDPFLVLPVAMAASVHMMVRWGGESGANNTEAMAEGMRTMMLWGMPVIIAGVTGFQPGLVALWFASSGAMGMLQAILLQRPALRKALGIAPLYKPSKEEVRTTNQFSNPFSRRTEETEKAGPARPVYQAPRQTGRPSTYKGGRVIDVRSHRSK
ncbi:60Kd inner membrane protein-domain-containing protein [Acrodontium crateriforme]|uniref:60Kd inner membrane protein-domain-containing protein n=1 Tax=Acrodontium crateriforme TaxID=150365 RepID=A0AAQ3LZA0_9PEZI|nr:60Kd inner membrane protein-domain-containing protein [Acrodontium crateriforme]